MTTSLNVVFLSGCGGDTQRYRCIHAVEQLHLLGHSARWFWHTDERVLTAIDQADILILHRPALTHYLETVLSHARGLPIIYESDDLIFDRRLIDQIPLIQHTNPFEQQRWYNYFWGNAQTLERCHGALTSTLPLSEHFNQVGFKAAIHENALSRETLESSDQARRTRDTDRPVTIGYFSGTLSHNHDFKLISPALHACLQSHADIRLLVGGYLQIPVEFHDVARQIDQRGFVPWQELPRMIAEADIVIAPLDLNDPFARSRSALKYLEAAALGLPVVASSVPAFAATMTHNETGLLATTLEDWRECLEALIAQPQLRLRLGDAAYTNVHTTHTLVHKAPLLEATLRTFINDHEVTSADRRSIDPTHETALQQWHADASLQNHSIFMLTGCDLGNAGNYRCRHPQQQLALHDVHSLVTDYCSVGLNLRQAATFDLAILHRVAWDDHIKTYIKWMQANGRPVVFDTDDLVFAPELIGYVDALKSLSAADVALYLDGVERYRQTLLACDAVIVSTEPLAERVRTLGKQVYVVRNALSWQQIEAAQPYALAKLDSTHPADSSVVIGYFSGTATHNKDFAQITDALISVLEHNPMVRLRIVGPLELAPAYQAFAGQIERRELVSLTELAQEIADVDVALAPLELDNPFCQGKSEVKYMEAAIVATPLIASPIEAFQFAIRHGDNGMLATTTEEWITALDTLIHDSALRRTLGMNAYHDVLERYTPKARSRTLMTALHDVWLKTQPIRNQTVLTPPPTQIFEEYADILQSRYATEQYLQDINAYVQHLESHIAELQSYTRQLEGHVTHIANGRIMRFLNKVAFIKGKVLRGKR